jgi:hypothetical protein
MSHTIISWDIGIKNLSYCILSYDQEEDIDIEFPIYKWGILNISSEVEEIHTCIGKTKTGKLCGKRASYIAIDNYYCGTHSKKIDKIVKMKTKKKHKDDILTLGTNLMKVLAEYPEFLNVSQVVIENQPCLKSPTIKSVQMMLYSYFILNGLLSDNSIINNIKLISATNKLKKFNVEMNFDHIKSKYTRRKKMSVECCKQLLINDTPNLELITSYKKADDLSDAMLQGAYYLKYVLHKKK